MFLKYRPTAKHSPETAESQPQIHSHGHLLPQDTHSKPSVVEEKLLVVRDVTVSQIQMWFAACSSMTGAGKMN